MQRPFVGARASRATNSSAPSAPKNSSKPSAVGVELEHQSDRRNVRADTGNNRVMVYNAKHEFVAAWGAGVKTGEKTFEVCTSECKPGMPGFGKGQFDEPVAIAVDNAKGSPSNGDVYVVANTPPRKP